MKGYEKYQTLVATWAFEYMRPFIGADDQSKKMPEPSRVFLTKLFYGFTEISGAEESLRLSEVLISLAPPRSRKIKRDEYLKYHINAYLQEVYILKNRLNSYATSLKRVYSKTGQRARFDKHVDPLFKLVKGSFDNVVNVRGRHVHSTRYSDKGLDHLSALTFISGYEENLAGYAKFEFKSVQREWKDRVKSNNQETTKLLDLYFEGMYSAVTDDRGKVVVPNSALQATRQDARA